MHYGPLKQLSRTLCGCDKGWIASNFFMEEKGEMMTAIHRQQTPAGGDFQEDGSVEEISLLLEPSLLERLKELAEVQGMAAASLIRRLLREFLHHPAAGQRIPTVRWPGGNPSITALTPVSFSISWLETVQTPVFSSCIRQRM